MQFNLLQKDLLCSLVLTLQCCLLTALPLGVAQFQVSAGASWVLLGAIRASQVLDLAVEGLERGINLNIMLSQGAGGLISSHVPERIRGFLNLTQAGKCGHVNSRARRTGGTRRSSVTRRTLNQEKKA